MCLLIVRPAYEELDPMAITLGFYGNPDGAGLAWNTPHGVQLRKGLMTEHEVISALANVPADVDLLLHFRLATSGPQNQGMTHPFPVTNNEKILRSKLRGKVPAVFAHNGILHLGWSKEELAYLSDTALFVRDVVGKLDLSRPASHKALDKLARHEYSYFALLTAKGFRLYGEWPDAVNGVWYSDLSWMSWTPRDDVCPTCGQELDNDFFCTYCGQYADFDACVFCDDIAVLDKDRLCQDCAVQFRAK